VCFIVPFKHSAEAGEPGRMGTVTTQEVSGQDYRAVV
jgi:hypothetical protein